MLSTNIVTQHPSFVHMSIKKQRFIRRLHRIDRLLSWAFAQFDPFWDCLLGFSIVDVVSSGHMYYHIRVTCTKLFISWTSSKNVLLEIRIPNIHAENLLKIWMYELWNRIYTLIQGERTNLQRRKSPAVKLVFLGKFHSKGIVRMRIHFLNYISFEFINRIQWLIQL